MRLQPSVLLGVPTFLSLTAAALPSWTMQSMSVTFCQQGSSPYGCGPIQTTLDFVLRQAPDDSPSSPFTDTACHAKWVPPAYPTDWSICGNSSVTWKFINTTSAPIADFSMAITEERKLNDTTNALDSTSFHVTNNSDDPDSWLGCLSPPTGSPTTCSMDSIIFGHPPVKLNVTETYDTSRL